MVAFNFELQFKPKIISGEKRSTIRSTKRCDVGDEMQLYTGQRTKSCEKIKDTFCIAVGEIEINDRNMWRIFSGSCQGVVILPDRQLHMQEGFINLKLFVDFFRKKYGLPYRGWIHVWNYDAIFGVSK